MLVEVLPGRFAVCRLARVDDAWPGSGNPVFVAVTPDEVSVVCASGDVPSQAVAVEDGWAMLRVGGPLDFGLVGVIAALSATLAQAGIPIFVTSTYLTDYVMVKADRLDDAVVALREAGHRLTGVGQPSAE